LFTPRATRPRPAAHSRSEEWRRTLAEISCPARRSGISVHPRLPSGICLYAGRERCDRGLGWQDSPHRHCHGRREGDPFSAKVSRDQGPNLNLALRVKKPGSLALDSTARAVARGQASGLSALTHLYIMDVPGGTPKRLTSATPENSVRLVARWEWIAYSRGPKRVARSGRLAPTARARRSNSHMLRHTIAMSCFLLTEHAWSLCAPRGRPGSN